MKEQQVPPSHSLTLSLNVFGRERSIHLSVFNTRCVVVPFVAQSRPFYVRRSQFARPLYVLYSTFLHTRVCHMYIYRRTLMCIAVYSDGTQYSFLNV